MRQLLDMAVLSGMVADVLRVPGKTPRTRPRSS
jgi:hypothetical protein